MKASALSRLALRTEEPPITWLMATALARPDLVSLAAGFTDPASLPLREACGLLRRLLSSPPRGRAALQYGTTAGDGDLRRLSARRLEQLDRSALEAVASGDRRGAAGSMHPSLYAPERLFITSGSQQLLYVVSECLCDPGDLVLVEDPTYFVYLGIVQSHGLGCRGIRMTPEGLDVHHLEETLEALRRSGDLSRLKLLYLVTYYQNPTGITTSLARKATALALLRRYEKAAGHPLYLVEDAAYRELRFAGPDIPSSLTLPGARERVVYAATYSKPFATGVRVGFGVLPAPLLERVLRIKANHDFGTSNLLQQLLREALTSGAYEAHLAMLRRRYARKADVMIRALRRHLPDTVHWNPPGGGLYVWARVPESVRSGFRSRFFRAAMREGVLYVPGELCYAPDPDRPVPGHEMRLSFGGASLADIRTGIARLGAALATV